MRHMNTQSDGLDIGTCHRGTRSRRGFTLVELLVVVAVIALLIGILVPALAGARNAAVQVQEQSNLRQMGIAMAAYSNTTGRFMNLNNPDPKRDRKERWRAVVALWDYTEGNREIFISPSAPRLDLSFSNPDNLLKIGSVRPCAKLAVDIETFARTKDESKVSYDTTTYSYDWRKDVVNEYWMNDSKISYKDARYKNLPANYKGPTSYKDSGVAGRKVTEVAHPEEVVLATFSFDTIDRFKGGNYYLMGDQRVVQMSQEQVRGPDKFGSVADFYNWGHYYDLGGQN